MRVFIETWRAIEKNTNHYQQILLHATVKIQCARVPVSLVFFGTRCANFCAHNLEKLQSVLCLCTLKT